MKSEPIPAIGECPCPESGCVEKVEVRKYRERSGRGSMFKGKFYGNCRTHGRVIDASRPQSQEHFLTKGTVWGAAAGRQTDQSHGETKPLTPKNAARAGPITIPPRDTPAPSSQTGPKPAQQPTPQPEKRSGFMAWLTSGWGLKDPLA